MVIKGSCHCKGTTFEVAYAPETVTYCTCSNCSRRGALWAYYRPADVKITSDEANAIYQWGAKIGKYHFCSRCGNSTYVESPDWSKGEPDFDYPKISINSRLFDDFDLDKVEVVVIDGKNLW